jgi:hypothetical protein
VHVSFHVLVTVLDSSAVAGIKGIRYIIVTGREGTRNIYQQLYNIDGATKDGWLHRYPDKIAHWIWLALPIRGFDKSIMQFILYRVVQLRRATNSS